MIFQGEDQGIPENEVLLFTPKSILGDERRKIIAGIDLIGNSKI
jgi:hypothetical protein